MLSGEATYTNFIVFGLTQPGLEPTIYRTRGEHANHYTTDAVCHKTANKKNSCSMFHLIYEIINFIGTKTDAMKACRE
jgi:hypothetical protein